MNFTFWKENMPLQWDGKREARSEERKRNASRSESSDIKKSLRQMIKLSNTLGKSDKKKERKREKKRELEEEDHYIVNAPVPHKPPAPIEHPLSEGKKQLLELANLKKRDLEEESRESQYTVSNSQRLCSSSSVAQLSERFGLILKQNKLKEKQEQQHSQKENIHSNTPQFEIKHQIQKQGLSIHSNIETHSQVGKIKSCSRHKLNQKQQSVDDDVLEEPFVKYIWTAFHKKINFALSSNLYAEGMNRFKSSFSQNITSSKQFGFITLFTPSLFLKFVSSQYKNQNKNLYLIRVLFKLKLIPFVK